METEPKAEKLTETKPINRKPIGYPIEANNWTKLYAPLIPRLCVMGGKKMAMWKGHYIGVFLN